MASSRTSSTSTEGSSLSAGGSSRSVERFVLTGPSLRLDPRVHAFRGDLADVALADRLFAPHYARGEPTRVSAVLAPVLDRPGGRAVSELAMGEGFAVLDRAGGWAWGSCGHDGYVGYVAADALGDAPEPTHVVHRPAALLFSDADIKSRVIARWPLGTRFHAEEAGGDFLRAQDGYVHGRHARSAGDPITDPVALAEALVGTPYRWGGRGGDGIDCSGLVQRAWGLAGTALPRDSDQQRAVGQEIGPDEPLRRGDLVFLAGHVGIMAGGERMVHANAHWMALTIEPLADVLARAGGVDAVVARRRLA